jgi:ABC-type amino acid transport substrate-binding protein
MIRFHKIARGAALAAGFICAASMGAQAETLKVAVDIGYAPHVMAKASGGVEGYNVDLMAAMA